MINLGTYKGFGLALGDTSLEANRLSLYCLLNDNILLKRFPKEEKCPEDFVPSSSVEWCEKSFDIPVVPDYYPDWCSQYLYRKVWREDKWILGRKLFVKPADRYKRFTGFITTGTYKKKKKPPLIWSEILFFKNEWRYYITKGKVVCGEWYWGDEENTTPAPELNIKIPEDYSGALDFGELANGKLALIESQHPFACGWYGPKEKDHLYFQWIIDGWNYMMNINKLLTSKEMNQL